MPSPVIGNHTREEEPTPSTPPAKMAKRRKKSHSVTPTTPAKTAKRRKKSHSVTPSPQKKSPRFTGALEDLLMPPDADFGKDRYCQLSNGTHFWDTEGNKNFVELFFNRVTINEKKLRRLAKHGCENIVGGKDLSCKCLSAILPAMTNGKKITYRMACVKTAMEMMKEIGTKHNGPRWKERDLARCTMKIFRDCFDDQGNHTTKSIKELSKGPINRNKKYSKENKKFPLYKWFHDLYGTMIFPGPSYSMFEGRNVCVSTMMTVFSVSKTRWNAIKDLVEFDRDYGQEGFKPKTKRMRIHDNLTLRRPRLSRTCCRTLNYCEDSDADSDVESTCDSKSDKCDSESVSRTTGADPEDNFKAGDGSKSDKCDSESVSRTGAEPDDNCKAGDGAPVLRRSKRMSSRGHIGNSTIAQNIGNKSTNSSLPQKRQTIRYCAHPPRRSVRLQKICSNKSMA